MKKIIAILVMCAMIAVSLPTVLADPPEQTPGTPEIGPEMIQTTATVSAGGGLPPFVKVKWETTNGPGGDGNGFWPYNDSDMVAPGIQVDPVCDGDVRVWYWAICTDPEGGLTVNNVHAEVWHPDGIFKYQFSLPNKLNRTDSIACFEAVAANNPTILTYNPLKYYDSYGAEHTMNYTEVHYELTQEHAFVWWGYADINYCQPAGNYTVAVYCFDDNNQDSAFLYNHFWYVPTVCIDYQFSEVNYGPVQVGTEKQCDTTKWVRNTGNVPVTFDVEQNDMDLGMDGGLWNLFYAARLGAFGTKVTYDPFVRTSIPDVLDLCTQEKLDFFITITKAFSGPYTGNMSLWALQYGSPLDPYVTPLQFHGT
jgi:hypothetical protein